MAEHFRDYAEPSAEARRRAELESYIEEHTTREHPYLRELYRATQVHMVRPHMASGRVEGKLLGMIVALAGAKRVLEIGTYTGYSALSMAEAMDEGGVVVTYEINDELEDFTRRWIEGSPWAERVDLRIGDALKDLGEGERDFDVVFIDGDKRQYTDYYELAMERVRKGGLIMADNTLWDGHTTDARYDSDSRTRGIRAFNDLAAGDVRVDAVMLAVRDGLTLIRKK